MRPIYTLNLLTLSILSYPHLHLLPASYIHPSHILSFHQILIHTHVARGLTPNINDNSNDVLS